MLEYFENTNTLALALFLWALWSAGLFFVTLLVKRWNSAFFEWPCFWQVMFALTFAPALPFSLFAESSPIPASLLETWTAPEWDGLINPDGLITQLAPSAELNLLLITLLVSLLAGSAIGLFRYAINLYRVHKLFRQACPISTIKTLNTELTHLLRHKQLSTYITQAAVSPFVFGLFKTRLMLPQGVLSLPSRQLNLLLAHELRHVQQHDHRAVLLFRLLTALFWFNPFLRFCEKHFLASMELHCDKAVIAKYPEQKADYARALLANLKLQRGQSHAHFAPALFTSGDKAELEQRIRTVMIKPAQAIGHKHLIAFSALTLTLLALSSFASPTGPTSLEPLLLGKGEFPVANGYVSSPYNHISKLRHNRAHRGIDFAAATGSPITASFGGRVVIADDQSLHKNYGNAIVIQHANNGQSLYAHLDTILVKPGERIAANQVIGTVGETGRTTGPHLHFELLIDGKRVDPSRYLKP